jgi:hypothetical protein
MVFCLGLEVRMGKRRRLRKSGGGELEVNMQDVASDEAILPSVAELGSICKMLHQMRRFFQVLLWQM